MWSDSSSDDVSMLDEEEAEALTKAVEAPYAPPMMCPVCSACKYGYKIFPDYKSLRQHAAARIIDLSQKQKKVKEFHEAVVQKVDDLMGKKSEHLKAARRGQTSKDGKTPAFAQPTHTTEDVSEALRQVYTDLERSNKKIREHHQAINQIDMEQGRKRRQMLNVASALDNVKYEARSMTENYREVKEVTSKEVMQELAEHAAYRAEQDRAIEACMARTAEIKAKLAEEGDQMSEEGRQYYCTQLRKMTKASAEIQKEKEKAEELLEKTRKEKQLLEEQFKEAERISDFMDKQIAEMEALMNEPLALDEDQKEIIDNIDTHLRVTELSIKCSKCNRTFNNQGDNSATACRRVLLQNCHCSDFCADCVSKFKKCPTHNTSIGKPMPYIFNG